jgi:hypothetical protein
MAKQPTPANVTRAEFQEFLDLRKRRRELNQEAANLERAEKITAAKLLAMAQEAGGTLKKHGHQITAKKMPGRPAWKDEVIKALGADAATAIQLAAPPVFVLAVE